ncbi:FhaA domain-containing protein [Citricoccus nitrophenolicus]|uniref:FhaA domain-containing protein n=1 Tax=Citricoccus nitrophenolicus TaxID=863575 RepID=UPI0031F08079
MGLLDNLERGLEKAVQSAFSAGGSRAVKPVEIANALRLAMDDESLVLSQGRTFVPNVFTVKFSTADFEQARKWGSALAEELCDEAIRHARDQGYTLHGPVRVTFVEDTELRAGKLDIAAESDKTGGSAPSHDAGRSPSGTGSSAAVSQAPVDREAPAPPVAPVPAPRPEVRQPAPSPSPQHPARPTRPDTPLQPVLEIDGRKYGLNAESIVLGRAADADILVEDTGVSRRHLEIITRGATVTAVDLGSTNGFHVNDRKVDGSTVLRDGDRIRMGRVTMVFRMLPARGNRSQGGNLSE